MTSFLNLYSCWILFIGYQVPKSTLKTTTPIAEGELLRNLFHKLQQDLLCGDGPGCLPFSKHNPEISVESKTKHFFLLENLFGNCRLPLDL